ncbi:MAG: methyl-accepting chemotaxis protein [Methylomicrobium sp.]
MTVARKMTLLVAVAIIGMVALAWVSQSKIESVFDKTNFANINSVPAIIALNQATEGLGRMRVRIYRHAINDDLNKIPAIESSIVEAKNQVLKAFKAYEATITDTTDRQMFDEDVAAFDAYIKGAETALAFSRQNQNDQARYALEQNSNLADRVNAAFKAHMDYNIDLAQKASDEAVVTKSAAVWLSIGIATVILLTIATVGWFITRNLLRQLGGEPDFAAAVANKIAIGDLSMQIDVKDNDKVSVMAAMKNMVTAIQSLVNDANMLAESAQAGRLNNRADASKHQGDFRKVIEGVNSTLDGVIVPLNEAIDVLARVERGDLTRTVEGNYQGQLNDFKQTVNNTIVKLSQTIAEVVAAADQLGSASEQISATSQSLSQASSEQAAGVEETSASIEQMAASINQNSENAKVTDGMAVKAAKEAAEGGEAVKQTVAAMKDIAAKIGIIDDIAYQTNMLALNAAIEAARAGDHGKGFAVVAAEVRKLAERSQIAAQEIGELAESSVTTAESAGKLLDEIVPSIAKTSDLVQEIAAASQEQSSGVSQVNTAMNQMNQITQQNASASEELAATAEEMTGQAEQLQNLMSFFTLARSEKKAPVFAVKTPKKIAPVKAQEEIEAAALDSEFDLKQFARF